MTRLTAVGISIQCSDDMWRECASIYWLFGYARILILVPAPLFKYICFVSLLYHRQILLQRGSGPRDAVMQTKGLGVVSLYSVISRTSSHRHVHGYRPFQSFDVIHVHDSSLRHRQRMLRAQTPHPPLMHTPSHSTRAGSARSGTPGPSTRCSSCAATSASRTSTLQQRPRQFKVSHRTGRKSAKHAGQRRTLHGRHGVPGALELVLREALALQDRRGADGGELDVVVGAGIACTSASRAG